MRNLSLPQINVSQIITDCVSNMRSPNHEKFLRAIDVISEYTVLYDKKMREGAGYELQQHSVITDELQASDMIKLYKNKLVTKGQPGRKYYDKIILAPRNGVCPLCGVGTVTALDHYLPKTKYPKLAVSAENLVPICADCNKNKLDVSYSSFEEMSLHPYYDDAQQEEWLFAELVAGSPVSVRYYVSDSLPSLLKSRLKSHMKVFKLSKLFSIKAAEEISEFKRAWMSIYRMNEENGNESLQNFFRSQYNSCMEYQKNSWRTALYRALSEQIDVFITSIE